MATNDELNQRLAAVEDRLQMDVDPPLDPLSTIEHKLDGLRDLLNHHTITQGELSRGFVRLEAQQLQHSRDISTLKADMAETKAGVQAILRLLTNRDHD